MRDSSPETAKLHTLVWHGRRVYDRGPMGDRVPPTLRLGSTVSLVGADQKVAELANRFGWTLDERESAAAVLTETGPQRYEELDLLGSGGMGVVWRVRDRHLGRSVARKSLRPELAAAGVPRARFIAEAEVTAQLTHPGVIPVFDLGEMDGGLPYYTMKEVSGQTLGDVRGPGRWTSPPCAGSGPPSSAWPRPSPTPTPAGWCTAT